jgi:hypothetical protein
VLDQEECALNVDVELAVVKGLVDLGDRHELGDPSVDEQDINAAVFGLDLVDQGLGIGHVACVGEQDLDSGKRRLGDFHRALAGAGNDHCRAFGLKEFGGLRTDTAGASADESDLAVECFLTGWIACPREMGLPMARAMAATADICRALRIETWPASVFFVSASPLMARVIQQTSRGVL